jgi:hypothetical protein
VAGGTLPPCGIGEIWKINQSLIKKTAASNYLAEQSRHSTIKRKACEIS